MFAVVIIALLLIGYFKLAYTPSHDVEEFPIPREAHLVKTTVGEDYVTEKYKWFSSCFRGNKPFILFSDIVLTYSCFY